MKIALIYDAIYPYIKGGGERRFYEISKRLTNKGHQVHLYGMKSWEGADFIKRGKIYLHGISKVKGLYTKEGKRSILQAIYFGLCSVKLIKEDFDVIDCCGFPYFSLFSCKIASLIKKKKLYSTWHEVWGFRYWREYLGKLGILGYLIERLSVLMPDIIISVSQLTSKRVRDELGFRRKVYVATNGIDFNRIQQINAVKEKFDIIYAGRLIDFKHIDILIKTIQVVKERIPTVKCIIIGEGPMKSKLKTLAQKLDLKENIKFQCFMKNNDNVYAFMKSSKVFVLPSTREGFGIVVIEANACGIPVITVNHKDNAAVDLIKEGRNGFICGLNKIEIAGRIIRILENNSVEEMRKACMDSAKKYDWDNIVDKIEKIYSNL